MQVSEVARCELIDHMCLATAGARDLRALDTLQALPRVIRPSSADECDEWECGCRDLESRFR